VSIFRHGRGSCRGRHSTQGVGVGNDVNYRKRELRVERGVRVCRLSRSCYAASKHPFRREVDVSPRCSGKKGMRTYNLGGRSRSCYAASKNAHSVARLMFRRDVAIRRAISASSSPPLRRRIHRPAFVRLARYCSAVRPDAGQGTLQEWSSERIMIGMVSSSVVYIDVPIDGMPWPTPRHTRTQQTTPECRGTIPAPFCQRCNVCCGPGTPGCTPTRTAKTLSLKSRGKSKRGRMINIYQEHARCPAERCAEGGICSKRAAKLGAVVPRTYGCVWLLLLKKSKAEPSPAKCNFGEFGRPSSRLALPKNTRGAHQSAALRKSIRQARDQKGGKRARAGEFAAVATGFCSACFGSLSCACCCRQRDGLLHDRTRAFLPPKPSILPVSEEHSSSCERHHSGTQQSLISSPPPHGWSLATVCACAR
jgi:hypothetical protein